VGHSLSSQAYQIECLTSVKTSILQSDQWYQALDAMLLHIQQAEKNYRPSQTSFLAVVAIPSLVKPKILVVKLSRDG